MTPYCKHIRDQFSAYLDGAVTGTEMGAIAVHLDGCSECAAEFHAWRGMQQTLTLLGPAKVPGDLALRLRVAISQERARTTQHAFDRLQMRWQNTFAPFLLRASAGLASAVLLVGTLALTVGLVATPVPAAGDDEPLPGFTNPHLLYSATAPASPDTTAAGQDAGLGSSGIDGNVIVEAYVGADGRIYDYRVLSGPEDVQTRQKLQSLLMFSVFQPALDFGQPVRGHVVLSFGGISVRG